MAKIKLDKERIMNLDLNGMVKFEEMTGKSLFQVNSMAELNSSDYRALILVCLQEDDPKLTLEDVGKLVPVSKLAEVANVLGELIGSQALPGGQKEEDPLPDTGQ